MSSADPLLLDTHIWVRYINGDTKLRSTPIQSIERARSDGAAYVSVISIWEIALLVRKKRLNLPFGVEHWVQHALELPGVRLLPLTPQIAIHSVQLPDSLNKDPSDRILVATAHIHNLTLMTRDKDIIRFAKQINLPIERA